MHSSDCQQFVRHLVGKQTHLRQRSIRAALTGVLGGEIFLLFSVSGLSGKSPELNPARLIW
jgi:hypothetical protein